MPRLPDLGKISDAEYKALSPEELMMYNKDLPTTDYGEQLGIVEYPKMKCTLINDAGGKRLRFVTVNSKEEEKGLKGDWRDGPAKWGIETAPAAPKIRIDDDFVIPVKEEDAAAGA